MYRLLLLGCLLLYFTTPTAANAHDDVQTSINVLKKSKDALDNIKEIMIKANPSKMFAQVSKVLGVLGPVMMAASAVLSVVAIFLPQEDSPELKAINSGFENVNRRLDVMTADIKDLRNIVELSSAKSAYVTYVTAIESTFEILLDAQKENTKASFVYFAKQYEMSYNLAAANLYDAMTGSLGPFGFNLVMLYKDHVRCNPVLVSKFCTMGMQLISKGLTIEGAYIGSLNLTDKANSKKKVWEEKMQVLGDACESVIRNCEDNWQITSAQQFRETYNKALTDNNQEFANKIAESLNAVAPQRGWFVISYRDASGFGEHGFSSFYQTDKIWDQNDHDVTIFSGPLQEPLAGSQYNQMKTIIDKQKSRFNNCNMMDWGKRDTTRYGGNDVRSLLNLIREVYQAGVVYTVRLDKNPGYAATGNTVYSSDFNWQCNSQSYRLMVFV